MTTPSDKVLNWHVMSVHMYLFGAGWFSVTLVQWGGGGPDAEDRKIEYITDQPPRVGSIVRINVEEVRSTG